MTATSRRRSTCGPRPTRSRTGPGRRRLRQRTGDHALFEICGWFVYTVWLGPGDSVSVVPTRRKEPAGHELSDVGVSYTNGVPSGPLPNVPVVPSTESVTVAPTTGLEVETVEA